MHKVEKKRRSKESDCLYFPGPAFLLEAIFYHFIVCVPVSCQLSFAWNEAESVETRKMRTHKAWGCDFVKNPETQDALQMATNYTQPQGSQGPPMRRSPRSAAGHKAYVRMRRHPAGPGLGPEQTHSWKGRCPPACTPAPTPAYFLVQRGCGQAFVNKVPAC